MYFHIHEMEFKLVQLFFLYVVLIVQLPRTASVIAIENTEVFQIKAQDFQDILITYSEVALSLLKILSTRIRKTLSKYT